MSSRHDYRRQATTYDRTRQASPSVLRALLAAIQGAPGPELLDIGGGTGNYSAALAGHGYRSTVVDASSAMLARATDKGLTTTCADATQLPFPDGSADAVILVSMLHHVPDWRTALHESARVLRANGRLAAVVFSRENVEHVGWLYDYFPSTRTRMRDQHPTSFELVAALPGARLVPFSFDDVLDGSVAALQRRPEMILDSAVRQQTSYFEQLGENNPRELASGLARLRADLAAGRDLAGERAAARDRHGDAVVISWTRPS